MSVLPRGSADRFCRGHNDVHATSPHACLAHYVRGRLRTVRLLLVTTRITITLRPNGPFDPTLGSTLLKCVWNRCAPNLQSGPRPSPPTKTAKHRVRTCVHCVRTCPGTVTSGHSGHRTKVAKVGPSLSPWARVGSNLLKSRRGRPLTPRTPGWVITINLVHG